MFLFGFLYQGAIKVPEIQGQEQPSVIKKASSEKDTNTQKNKPSFLARLFQKKDTTKKAEKNTKKELVTKKTQPDTTKKESVIKKVAPSNTLNAPENIKKTVAVSKKTANKQVAPNEAQKKILADLHKNIEFGNFDKSRELLKKLPDLVLSKKEKQIKKTLTILKKVDQSEKDNDQFFRESDAIPSIIEKAVKKLYKEGAVALAQGKLTTARDMLIHSLYLDRQNYRAKKLLELGLDLPVGSYAIENIEKKYWKLSLQNIYSGLPDKAIESLEILSALTPTNPEIFKKMGSAYYMKGDPDKAVTAWQRALYLNPDDTNLQKFIENAKKEVSRQNKFLDTHLVYSKSLQEGKAGKEVDVSKMVVLRVATDPNVAYSYAQQVKEEMDGIDVSVEETSPGKWSVMIPKDTKDKKNANNNNQKVKSKE